MGWFGPQSGTCSCCGGPCVILEDDFDRANSTNIGSDWTEEAQNWEISSNVLYCPAQNGVAMTVAERASSSVNYTVSGIVTSNGRLLFDADDVAGTYHYVEYQYSAFNTKIVIGDQAGTIDTHTVFDITDYQTSPSSGILLKVCVTGSTVLVNFGDTNKGVALFSITAKNGLKAGVGTGSYASTGSCNNFAYQRRSASCDDCIGECSTECCSSPVSYEYTVDIPALNLSGGSCACDGVFEGGEVTMTQLQDCVWIYDPYGGLDCAEVPAVGECYYFVRLQLSGCVWTLRIVIGKYVTDGDATCGRVGTDFGNGYYTYTQSNPSDCGSFEYTLSYDSMASNTDPDCSHTWPSTVTLTPV